MKFASKSEAIDFAVAKFDPHKQKFSIFTFDVTLSGKTQKKLKEALRAYLLIDGQEEKINTDKYEITHVVACPKDIVGALYQTNQNLKVVSASLEDI